MSLNLVRYLLVLMFQRQGSFAFRHHSPFRFSLLCSALPRRWRLGAICLHCNDASFLGHKPWQHQRTETEEKRQRCVCQEILQEGQVNQSMCLPYQTTLGRVFRNDETNQLKQRGTASHHLAGMSQHFPTITAYKTKSKLLARNDLMCHPVLCTLNLLTSPPTLELDATTIKSTTHQPTVQPSEERAQLREGTNRFSVTSKMALPPVKLGRDTILCSSSSGDQNCRGPLLGFMTVQN